MSKGNIYVKFGDAAGIFLFTQKRGDSLLKIAQSALQRSTMKWGETHSVTRAIFTEMTEKDLTIADNYGISPIMVENEGWIVGIDDQLEMVGVFAENGRLIRSFSFADFLGMAKTQLDMGLLIPGAERFDAQYGLPKGPFKFDAALYNEEMHKASV